MMQNSSLEIQGTLSDDSLLNACFFIKSELIEPVFGMILK